MSHVAEAAIISVRTVPVVVEASSLHRRLSLPRRLQVRYRHLFLHLPLRHLLLHSLHRLHLENDELQRRLGELWTRNRIWIMLRATACEDQPSEPCTPCHMTPKIKTKPKTVIELVNRAPTRSNRMALGCQSSTTVNKLARMTISYRLLRRFRLECPPFILDAKRGRVRRRLATIRMRREVRTRTSCWTRAATRAMMPMDRSLMMQEPESTRMGAPEGQSEAELGARVARGADRTRRPTSVAGDNLRRRVRRRRRQLRFNARMSMTMDQRAGSCSDDLMTWHDIVKRFMAKG